MEPRDREYEALRREIEKLSELEQAVYSILYVGVTAVLAWGVSSKNSLICLLTYCIIFPSFHVVLSYTSGMLRIGAYMYVFYDEYFWEKRLYQICNLPDIKKIRYNSSFKSPFVFVSILSTMLALIIPYTKDLNQQDPNVVIACLSIISLAIFIIYSCKQGNCDTIRQQYINGFKKIKAYDDNFNSNLSSQNSSLIPLETLEEQSDCSITNT